ncbi:DEAD/DEAH box helicase family protein [Arcanobacterium phocae]|uniref:DEAD/DEAH box helicase family protein n=1 Tax=Arcanobacterium phocae TaxID=131112 RepID=UPI001C0E8F9A|nr:DEAD/DEAH box helicase family protein [Arcanobacterium phocae]
MSDHGKIILTKINNDPRVRDPLVRLLHVKEKISYEDAFFLYSVAHLLVQEYVANPSNDYLLEYAYYITVKTSFKLNDFTALYDLSFNLGFYPLARKIVELDLPLKSSVAASLTNIEIENFNDGEKILTLQQWETFTRVLGSKAENLSFIAPTSYGKSKLIIKYILQNPEAGAIAVIVPTKSLIYQVYNDFKNLDGLNRKIIIHDQNYRAKRDQRVLAIVTQERALRLYDRGLVFDVLFVDEAHEIMKFDFGQGSSNRSVLLTRLLRLSKMRNPKLKTIYLSPVVNEVENLRFRDQEKIEEYRIERDLKLYEITYVDAQGKSYLYDKYLDRMVGSRVYENSFEFIKKRARLKNLYYLYRPKYIEQYSKKLYDLLPSVSELDEEISELIDELKCMVHPTFKLAKYLEKGIVYLHAKLPITIRNYLITFIKRNPGIQHVVANSVILAGMNLPIDNLFYISGYSDVNDLINLMGRVNRLAEIFNSSNGSLSKILLPINFVEFTEFPQPRRGSLESKIRKLRKKRNDIVKNPLLENARIDRKNRENSEEIVSSENYILQNVNEDDFKAILSKSGAQSLLNYTSAGLKKLQGIVDSTQPAVTTEIIDLIKTVFFDNFVDGIDFSPQHNVSRLRHQQTINYYKIFIENMQNKPLNFRIENLVGYWRKNKGLNRLIYIGSAFGEEAYQSQKRNYYGKVYINIDKYVDNEDEIYNLALVKIQSDEEFISHEITTLINALFELGLITEEQLNHVLYGTNVEEELLALEMGLSRSAFMRIKEDGQLENISFDIYGNPRANKQFKEYIKSQTGIFWFELDGYFGG